MERKGLVNEISCVAVSYAYFALDRLLWQEYSLFV